jgi:hypothetical protein
MSSSKERRGWEVVKTGCDAGATDLGFALITFRTIMRSVVDQKASKVGESGTAQAGQKAA